MKPVSKKVVIGVLTRIVVMVIIAKALSLGLLWWLPSDGVSLAKKPSVQPQFQRYNLRSFLDDHPLKTTRQDRPTAQNQTQTESYATLSDLVLKGLYGKEAKGFVMIAMKNAQDKVEVIGVGEAFRGYTLRTIHADHAVFEREGKRYSLAIEAPKLPEGALTVPARGVESVNIGKPQAISREQIDTYTQDINKVWKDISIREEKKDGKIVGFKVIRIRAGSPLAQLGLQRSDVIVKVNNKMLDSYAAAVDVYKQIDKLKALELTVLRDNQEKEILYEIY